MATPPVVEVPFLLKTDTTAEAQATPSIWQCQDHFYATQLLKAIDGSVSGPSDAINAFQAARQSAIEYTIPPHLREFVDIKAGAKARLSSQIVGNVTDVVVPPPTDLQHLSAMMLTFSATSYEELVQNGFSTNSAFRAIMDRLLPRSAATQTTEMVIASSVGEVLFFFLTGLNLTLAQRMGFWTIFQSVMRYETGAESTPEQNAADIASLTLLAQAFKPYFKVSLALSQLYQYYTINRAADDGMTEQEFELHLAKCCTVAYVFLLATQLLTIIRDLVVRLWDNWIEENYLILYQNDPETAANFKYKNMSFQHAFIMESLRLATTLPKVKINVDEEIVGLIQYVTKQYQIEQQIDVPTVGSILQIDLSIVNQQKIINPKDGEAWYLKQGLDYPFFDVEDFNPQRDDLHRMLFFQPTSWTTLQIEIKRAKQILFNIIQLDNNKKNNAILLSNAITKMYNKSKKRCVNQLVDNNETTFYSLYGIELIAYIADRYMPQPPSEQALFNNSENAQNTTFGIDNYKLMDKVEELMVLDNVHDMKKKYVIEDVEALFKTLDPYTTIYGQLVQQGAAIWNRRPPHGIDQPIPNQPIEVYQSKITGALMAKPDEDSALFVQTVGALTQAKDVIIPGAEMKAGGYHENNNRRFKTLKQGELYRWLKYPALLIPNITIFASMKENLLLPNTIHPLYKAMVRNNKKQDGFLFYKEPQKYDDVMSTDNMLTYFAFYSLASYYTESMNFEELKTKITTKLPITPNDNFTIVKPENNQGVERNFVQLGLSSVNNPIAYPTKEQFQELFTTFAQFKSTTTGAPQVELDFDHYYISDVTYPHQWPARDNYYRYGALAVFDSLFRPIAIYVSHLNRFVVNPLYLNTGCTSGLMRLWNYAKYVWKSTFFLIVAWDLHLCKNHLIDGGAIALSTRDAVPLDHTFRHIMKPFTWRVIGANINADLTLYIERGVFARAWGMGPKEVIRLVRYATENYQFTPFPEQISATMLHEHPRVQKFTYDIQKNVDPTTCYNATKTVDYQYQYEMFYTLNRHELTANTDTIVNRIILSLNEWQEEMKQKALSSSSSTDDINLTIGVTEFDITPPNAEQDNVWNSYGGLLQHQDKLALLDNTNTTAENTSLVLLQDDTDEEEKKTTTPVKFNNTTSWTQFVQPKVPKTLNMRWLNTMEFRQRFFRSSILLNLVQQPTTSQQHQCPPDIFSQDVMNKLPIMKRALRYYYPFGIDNTKPSVITTTPTIVNKQEQQQQLDTIVQNNNTDVDDNNNAGIVVEDDGYEIIDGAEVFYDPQPASASSITTTGSMMELSCMNPQWDRVYPLAYDSSRFWSVCAHYMSAMYDILCLSKNKDKNGGIYTNNLFDESIEIDLAPFFVEPEPLLNEDGTPIPPNPDEPVNFRTWERYAANVKCPYTKWFNYVQIKAYAGVVGEKEEQRQLKAQGVKQLPYYNTFEKYFKLINTTFPGDENLALRNKLKCVIFLTEMLVNGSASHEFFGQCTDLVVNPAIIGAKLYPENMQRHNPSLSVQEYSQFLLLGALAGAIQTALLDDSPQLFYNNTKVNNTNVDPFLKLHWANWLCYKYDVLQWMVECDWRNRYCRNHPLGGYNPRNFESSVSI